MEIERIRTEYLVNPLGLGSKHPVITWSIKGEGLLSQSAYEIAYSVNEGEERKEVKETSSMRHLFAEELHSRDYVTYKIRVKNEKGEWSSYSEPQHFSLGLLSKTDWSAGSMGTIRSIRRNVIPSTVSKRNLK